MKHRLLLDTNLLVLLLVGSWRPQLISTFKTTSAFSVRDYDLLLDIVCAGSKLVATPHVLAETSNLIRGVDHRTRTALRECLRQLVGEVTEFHVPATTATADGLFSRLGLTDAGISVLASREDVSVVTGDLDLYVGLLDAGVDAVNFNHYRLQ